MSGTSDGDRLRRAKSRLARAEASGVGVEAAERVVAPLQALSSLDALVKLHRQRDRMGAARTEAVAEGLDPERAARLAARDPDEPLVHEVAARRDRKTAAALDAGRVTPVEARRFRQAMEDADEESVTALIERMPPGRVPLDPVAWCPDPENPDGSGPLPDSASLLSRAHRAELSARRTQ